jgi:hypothetical protein
MSNNYTYDQLEQALGPTFKLAPIGKDKTQARVLTADGFDIAFIDFENGRIEADLDAKWRVAVSSVPEGFPDAKAIAAARQEIAEELQPDWEIAGFTVPEDGSVAWHRYAKEPETKLPMYRIDVSKDALTLEDAVKTLHWVRSEETETWL